MADIAGIGIDVIDRLPLRPARDGEDQQEKRRQENESVFHISVRIY
jgi:hypothetical protein